MDVECGTPLVRSLVVLAARRSLAAAERKIGDLESSVEEAETRLKSREDQYREERAKRLGLDEELATLRHDLLTRDKDSVAAAMKDEELQRALKAMEEAKARSIHWSPYDPVGVVNAVP